MRKVSFFQALERPHWKIRGVMAAKVIIIIAKPKWTPPIHTRLNRPTHSHIYLLLVLGPLWRHILLVALIILFSLGLLESCQQLSARLVAHLTFIYAKMWNHLWNLPSTHSSSTHPHTHPPAKRTSPKKRTHALSATKNYALLRVRKKRVRESSFCRQSKRRGEKSSLLCNTSCHTAPYR